MSPLTVQVARIPVTLEFPGRTANILARRRYREFLSREKSDFHLAVRRLRMPPRSSDPRINDGGRRLSCLAERFGWMLDLKGGQGRASMDAVRAQDIDSLLRTIYSSLLPRDETLLIHAAALANQSVALMFVGVSGAGKTTLARRLGRLDEIKILSDELAAVSKSSAGFHAFSTPFWGEFRLPANNGSFPLAGVVFIEKSAPGEKTLTPLTRAQAQRRLWRCLVSFENSRESLERSWDLMLDILGACPAFVLRWNKAEPAAELAERLWAGCLQNLSNAGTAGLPPR